MDPGVWMLFNHTMDLACEAPFLPPQQMLNNALAYSVPPFASIVCDHLYAGVVVPSVVYYLWQKMEER